MDWWKWFCRSRRNCIILEILVCHFRGAARGAEEEGAEEEGTEEEGAELRRREEEERGEEGGSPGAGEGILYRCRSG